MAVNLGITHLPLGPMLQTELGVPTFVEHDARAAALWLSEQAADGSAETPTSVAFLAIGPASRPASSSTGNCFVATTTSPAKWATSWPIPTGRLRVRPARLPRDHRRRPGDRSPGR